jgi:ribonucleoside-diphosphate reductase beta chain
MSKSIINTLNHDQSKEPMFFGKSLGLQRYDKSRYSTILKFYKQQKGFFWDPEELNLSKDSSDFKTMDMGKKHIFVKNLSYQILLDSVQGRGIHHIIDHTSNPEIEAFGKWWEAFEVLHSESYSHLIATMFSNPEDVFDEILNDTEVLKRAASVTSYYDELIEMMGEDASEDAMKKQFYLTLVSINILEGIRFYVSFACAYAFAEQGSLIGNAQMIGLIQRDENLHLGFTQFVLKKLRDEPSEGFQHIVEECEDLVYQMYKDAAQEEIEWAEYLFKDGEMIGLNSEILKKYMMFLTNSRMKVIGLTPLFDDIKKNPIPWITKWTDSKSTQVAPQETEITSYVIGGTKNDLGDVDFKKSYQDLL